MSALCWTHQKCSSLEVWKDRNTCQNQDKCTLIKLILTTFNLMSKIKHMKTLNSYPPYYMYCPCSCFFSFVIVCCLFKWLRIFAVVFFIVCLFFLLSLEIQLSYTEESCPFNGFNPASILCLSQVRTRRVIYFLFNDLR